MNNVMGITNISGISIPLILIIVSLWVLLAGIVLPKAKSHFTGVMTTLGLMAGVLYLWGMKDLDLISFGNALKFNNFVWLIWFVILLIALSVSFTSQRFVEDNGIEQAEYNFFLLIATTGLLLLVSAHDLLMLFISIEILSLSLYILAGIRRGGIGGEAAFKYFLLGSLGAALLVMGIALVYGSLGTLNFMMIKVVLERVEEPLILLIGFAFIIAGLAFKVALVPFHMWVPDVYEGSPTPVSGFMAAAVKAGGVIALLRVYNAIHDEHYVNLFWWLSVITMIAGNLMALPQTSIKRILAYSSVAHAGYMLVGFLGGDEGVSGILFYLMVYSPATLGAFLVVLLLEKKEIGVSLENVSGLARRHPFLATAMAIFVFSLAGIPPLAGFFGKLYVFKSAVGNGYTGLVIIAVIMSVLSLYYYLRIVVAMFMEEMIMEILPQEYKSVNFMIFVLILIALILGIFSNPLLSIAGKTIRNLM